MFLATVPHVTQPAHHAPPDTSQIDGLTLYGLLAVSLMLVTYALEKRSPLFVLAFAASCVMGSIYGFLQGAWPFGLVEAVWSVVAFRRWWRSRRVCPVFRLSNRLRSRRLTPPDSEESHPELN